MNNDQTIHVIPVNDYREYITDKNCWCNPLEDEEEPNIIIHNSMDQRELYETGQRPYN